MNLIPNLSSDDADQAIAAGIVAAAAAGIDVTIAVVDASGTLLGLKRMEGARGFSVDLAVRKARTSGAIGVSTAMLAQLYKDRPAPAEVMTLPGGVAVVSGGKSAGAVGISGATGEVDDAIAQAAAAAISTETPG